MPKITNSMRAYFAILADDIIECHGKLSGNDASVICTIPHGKLKIKINSI